MFLAWTWWSFARGRKVPVRKACLYASTALTSLWAWGANPLGMAFFIMNFFHAFQYFGLVWWSEKKSMRSLFRLENVGGSTALTLLLFLGISFGYGFWAEVFDTETVGRRVDVAWNIAIVVAIMHFWYDGFIWSVRKKQV